MSIDRDNLKCATKRYIDENQYVLSRPTSLVLWKRRGVVGWSVYELIRFHLVSLIRVVPSYLKEIIVLRGLLLKSFKIRGKNRDKISLVIGNGPSQGMLTPTELNEFKKRGGVTYCLNYWPNNEALREHIPSWLVFSDPDTFRAAGEGVKRLIEYIRRNASINLLAPASLLSEVASLEIKNEVYFFIDTELPCFRGTNPLLPRGYLSMTMYKALAWAQHLGSGKIGVIGMDNTYPRNIFCNSDNQALILKTHAGESDTAAIWLGCDVAMYIDDSVRLFRDLECFDASKIVNLDPYSLTDRFRKVEIGEFFKSQSNMERS